MNTSRRKTREYIRTEMLAEAARLWGYDDPNLALESFDPLVGLLLGSFATGLEQAYHELDNTQSRVVRQLVGLLLPEVFTGPLPAHAVLKAPIIDARFTTQTAHAFTGSHEVNAVEFSPIGTYPLYNIQLRKTLVQDRLREMGNPPRDSFLSLKASTHDYWLGLSIDPTLDAFEDLLLFVDWRNTPARAQYLAQLPDVRVFVGDVELKIDVGLPDSAVGEGNTQVERLARDIQAEYNRHFIRLTSREAATGKPVSFRSLARACPAELEPLLPPGDVGRYFTTDLVWLNLVFPGSYSPEAVFSAYVEANAFPVANLKLEGPKRLPLQSYLSILPISPPDGEYYVDMVEVKTPTDQSLPSAHTLSRHEPYWYLVRQGGVARFDARDGYEALRNLLNLLRDENAMFAGLNRSELETDLNLIREKVELLEKYREDAQPINYLTIRAPQAQGQFSLSYLTTRADQANKIPPGTPFRRTRELTYSTDGAMLLTSSTGGRRPLLPDEQLPAFRKALLSRDRIVTNQDVKNFCFAELGNKLKQVEIRKGVRVADTQPQGLERTVDVCLIPAPAASLKADEWADYTHRLETQLRTYANNSVNYRVILTA